MICFEIRASSSTSPPSPREGFHYPLRIFQQRSFHKGTTVVYTISEYTTLTLNPLHKR